MSDNSVSASVINVQNETNVNDSSTCASKPGNGKSLYFIATCCLLTCF